MELANYDKQFLSTRLLQMGDRESKISVSHADTTLFDIDFRQALPGATTAAAAPSAALIPDGPSAKKPRLQEGGSDSSAVDSTAAAADRAHEVGHPTHFASSRRDLRLAVF